MAWEPGVDEQDDGEVDAEPGRKRKAEREDADGVRRSLGDEPAGDSGDQAGERDGGDRRPLRGQRHARARACEPGERGRRDD